MNIEFDQITSFFDGKAGLITGLCQEINLHTIIDKHLENHVGRPPEIPYSSLAQMMLMNIAEDHHPLSRLKDYFENVDLESLLGHSVELNQLNDDRFGGFLDAMYEAGLEQIYSDISLSAFKRYGLKISNVNFDTTSKVMWGDYLTEEGSQGAIQISFGYSKQKRFDKKQIKFSLGTTQGIIVDGQVLSGNLDDKTYNVNNLERAKKIKENFNSEGDDFFYIADSAAFTKSFLQKSSQLDIDVITRMTDNLVSVKEAFEYTLDHLNELESVEIATATKPSKYLVYETECDYHNVPLKMVVCSSEKLRPQKERTIAKRVVKEYKLLTDISNELKKRSFACEVDANIEIDKLTNKQLKKLKYHTVNLLTTTVETKRPGRPSKDPEKNQSKISFVVELDIKRDDNSISRHLDKECLFVLACTKLDMSATEILTEYKTQSAVERKFQFMKSPQFINSLYLDSPRRIEALGYLLLILMLLLSVAEFVVRRELKKENQTIIGPGDRVMKNPSLMAIYRVFYSITTIAVNSDGKMHRGFNKPLKNNVKTILRHLGISENLYIRGAS
jgi:transposase